MGVFIYVKISDREWFQVMKSGAWSWEGSDDGVKHAGVWN